MAKVGRPALPVAEHKARGTYRKDRHGPKPEPPPARVRPSVDARILDDEEIWTGIPGYDARDLAGDTSWSREAAVRAIRFFHERLNHVKGATGPFVLEPWQQAVVGNLFGWSRPDGTRRYRKCLLYVPKKQGKTPIAAGILLYVLAEDDEPGMELYSAAYSKQQATIMFRYAAGMVRADPALSATIRVYGMSGGSQSPSLVRTDDLLSSYRPLAAKVDGADGANVHVAVSDELHRHPDGELTDILEKGMAARSQPLMLYTTTADTARDSVCNQKLAYARAVQGNKGDPSQPGHDPSFLPVIYEAARDDDWRSEETWRKANPNFGITVKRQFFQDQVREIEAQPSLLNSFLRFHLNIVTDAVSAALPMDEWDACPPLPSEDELKGSRCYGGLDVSSTIDLTAFVLFWPDLCAVRAWFWRPRATLREAEDRDRVPYHHWAEAGWLETCEGNAIDEAWIRQRVDQIAREYGMVKGGLDRAYGGRQIATWLNEQGHKFEELAQGHFTLAQPCTEMERMVVARKLRHGGNPILRWNASCLVWRYDANNSICYDKRKSTGRIDGMASLVMAIEVSGGQLVESNLERYGIRRL